MTTTITDIKNETANLRVDVDAIKTCNDDQLLMTKGPRSAAFKKNNEENTADPAFRRLFGKKEPESMLPWDQINASADGVTCYTCRSDFSVGEPIHKARTYLGRNVFGIYIIRLLSFCELCAPYCEYWETRCKTCSRRVSVPWDRVHHKRVFCSEVCSKRYWANYQRDQRLKKREVICQKECKGCEKAFTAPRSDTIYCSPACKQKAYRLRQGKAA